MKGLNMPNGGDSAATKAYAPIHIQQQHITGIMYFIRMDCIFVVICIFYTTNLID
jgi:hypothetical protein